LQLSGARPLVDFQRERLVDVETLPGYLYGGTKQGFFKETFSGIIGGRDDEFAFGGFWRNSRTSGSCASVSHFAIRTKNPATASNRNALLAISWCMVSPRNVQIRRMS
jgi:hypothetical protein